MLKQRVITGLALASIFIAALTLLPWQGFAVFVGVVFGIAAWEWSNLAGFRSLPARLGYAAVSVAIGLGLALMTDWTRDAVLLKQVFMVAVGWWAVALLWVQGYPASTVLWQSQAARAAMGWLVIVPAWLGAVYLHHLPYGAALIFIVVLAVACADVGAYFFGRAFGKRKLAKFVSPGKSWEGVAGGVLVTTVFSLAVGLYIGSQPFWLPMVIIIPAGLVSVLGDLLESMLKRHANVKDSSQLLPGHGGILDRVDGLVAAVPIFALGIMYTGWGL